MCQSANGSGELQKEAPPSIQVTAPPETPDAGLRSLDHCRWFLGLSAVCWAIFSVAETSMARRVVSRDKDDSSCADTVDRNCSIRTISTVFITSTSCPCANHP